MMFKFYQPQKKEQKMIEVSFHTQGHLILNNHSVGEAWIVSQSNGKRLIADLQSWLEVKSPVATTLPDPALLLAHRIAAIAAETGLKPRHVLSIVNQIRWEKEDEAFEATKAAAPQENQPDATDPAMVYAARIKAVMDLLGCDVNTARSVVINAEYFTKKAADNA
jgi:hypothetical protein